MAAQKVTYLNWTYRESSQCNTINVPHQKCDKLDAMQSFA